MAPSPTAVAKRKERRAEWVETNPLRVWRHERGFTISDVSTKCGNAFSGVYQHEQGGYKPSEAAMKKYASMMRVSHAALNAAWDSWLAAGQSLR
jgi:hypothetical protein